MNTGAVIIGRQNRYMRAFRQAGATGLESACTLESVDCRDSWIFLRMVDQGVFRGAERGAYYIDEAAAEAFLDRRRRRMLLAVLVVLAVALLFALR